MSVLSPNSDTSSGVGPIGRGGSLFNSSDLQLLLDDDDDNNNDTTCAAATDALEEVAAKLESSPETEAGRVLSLMVESRVAPWPRVSWPLEQRPRPNTYA